MNIASYMAKQYGPQPCWELVTDVVTTEGGELPVDYQTVNRSIREMASAFRLAIHKSPHGYAQIVVPVDLCIVLLGKTERMGVHHCGIYYDGKVLHAMPTATMYEDLSVIGDAFELVQYWAKP
jgi:hypothetical protein